MDFMPHGHCYFWEPGVLWSHVIGDGLTVIAYYAIPFLLLRFVNLRKDLKFKGIFVAFAAFIIACGTVHLFSIISTWYPFYRIEGALKLFTAAISLFTVYLLFKNFSNILSIPNPGALEALNQQLLKEIEEHKETQKVHIVKEALEQKVIQRTAELEEINKELEAFSYSVSHDLRAPLRAISGYSTIVKETYDKKLDEDGRVMLEHIIKSTHNMGALIDGLLNFSRLGRKGLSVTKINVNQLVNETWKTIWEMAEKPKINITISDLPSAEGDEFLMKQVWFNLISNAIKYSSKCESQTITINGKTNGKFAEYSITDNGVGFDMKYVDKIFGVFQRLHTDRDYEGIGVGLSFVQRIIHKHRGKVWVESEVNKGTTFYFRVPIKYKSVQDEN